MARHTQRLKSVIASLAATSGPASDLTVLLSEGEFDTYAAYLKQLLDIKVKGDYPPPPPSPASSLPLPSDHPPSNHCHPSNGCHPVVINPKP